MIFLSRINGKSFVLNCDHILWIEETPDAVIVLTTGERMMVREKASEIIEKTMDYRKRLLSEPPQIRKPGD